MNRQALELSYAIRFLTIGRYSGQRCLALALLASVPLLMTYPMMASGLNFVDALFESVSACTTTGLSTLATVADKPPIFLFARAWMQWFGGMGFVILSLALLVHPGLTAKTLTATDEHEEHLAGGTRAHARRVLLSHGGLTVIGILGTDMLMGRLEIVAWIVLFYPKTRIGKRAEV